jgi:hypothetical protein
LTYRETGDLCLVELWPPRAGCRRRAAPLVPFEVAVVRGDVVPVYGQGAAVRAAAAALLLAGGEAIAVSSGPHRKRSSDMRLWRT